ncbi:MAG: helix-turn-helix transcriptional regulator [Ruthenibacterium sp.]
MSAQWTAAFFGELKCNHISQKLLAEKIGVTPEYVSIILNGKREPKGAESKFRTALDKLILEKQENSPT